MYLWCPNSNSQHTLLTTGQWKNSRCSKNREMHDDADALMPTTSSRVSVCTISTVSIIYCCHHYRRYFSTQCIQNSKTPRGYLELLSPTMYVQVYSFLSANTLHRTHQTLFTVHINNCHVFLLTLSSLRYSTNFHLCAL